MSLEAIKLLTGYGSPLLSKLLWFNTLSMDFRKMNTRRDRHCKVCGDNNGCETVITESRQPS